MTRLICPDCFGSGEWMVEGSKCPRCYGLGTIDVEAENELYDRKVCDECGDEVSINNRYHIGKVDEDYTGHYCELCFISYMEEYLYWFKNKRSNS
jgi:Zn ribbon nucleic-acid-binding protein